MLRERYVLFDFAFILSSSLKEHLKTGLHEVSYKTYEYCISSTYILSDSQFLRNLKRIPTDLKFDLRLFSLSYDAKAYWLHSYVTQTHTDSFALSSPFVGITGYFSLLLYILCTVTDHVTMYSYIYLFLNLHLCIHSLLNDTASNPRDITYTSQMRATNQQECRRQKSWPTLRNYPVISLKDCGKPLYKNQDTRCSGPRFESSTSRT